jgi:hypothetical protein
MNKDTTTSEAVGDGAPGDSGAVVGVGGVDSIDSLDTVKRRQLADQDAFLANYATSGTILSAAKAANVSRQTVYNWRDSGALGFKARFEAAKDSFRESLEDIMFQRLRDPKTHPVLLIFALKGHWREKYGDTAIPSDDSAKDVLTKLMGWKQGRRNGGGGSKDGGGNGGGERGVEERAG